ncbi:MAG: adenylate/guanylate cyclase domain-containing protein [Spirochaetia bacterium]|jgi:class 3 adenylate cyclase
MNVNPRPKLAFHITEAAYSIVIILWYVLPFINKDIGSFDPRQLAGTLYGSPPAQIGAWILVTAFSYLIPLICLWKIASIFLARQIPFLADPERPVPILLNILSSGFAITLVIMHLVSRAASASYFAAFPPATYAVAGLSIGYNGYFIVMLIMWLSTRDSTYLEYLEFRRTDEDARGRGVLSALQRQGIQRKMLLTFVPLIIVIIFILAFSLLRDFSSTILAAVYANGEGLADRTASVVKANPSDKDRISLDDYFGAEAKKNSATTGQNDFTRFNKLAYYRRDVRGGGFQIWASTDRKQIDERVAQPETALTGITSRYNPTNQTYEFLAPVTLSNVSIGYIMVDYARDVIYEPYFRTQVKVFVIAALFMYLSIFLIYLFGRAIVFPILFLRMSVNGIATTLSSMIKGKLRISSDLLQYKDRVNTRDEIKLLSNEVGNMATVIRGVIPYISASTLKHAERETPMTERRNLTFLFTDIRGFTTISESMIDRPDKVVEMLNHYLELQSSVISECGGEVDKFVGDEIMAMFEGPKKELNACKASLEIRKTMAEEKELNELEKKKVISIGIGINSGEVVFGSVGAKDRMDFTSIGDTVNLAARLEGTNKEYGTKTLITKSVYDKVKEAYVCREIDLLTVKGKNEPVRIYELLQETKTAAEKLIAIKKLFEASLALYRKQKWDAAEKGFAALVKDYRDEASEIFLERVAAFRKDPPPKDWDGVFHRTSK